jgi:SAM-dependent methyltransferase
MQDGNSARESYNCRIADASNRLDQTSISSNREVRVTIAPYDPIADEYYDTAHKTSRNFDDSTAAAVGSLRHRVGAEGLVLDIGAGRGRCKEFLGIDPRRVVHLDNSSNMLQVAPREQSLLRVVHQAEELPFLDGQFSCVTSFLCDPFLGLNFLAEAYRVLKRGGLFIATTPAYEWGSTLRTMLEMDKHSTRFITRNGILVIPSVLVPISQLREMLKRTGFNEQTFSITAHTLPRAANPVSEDISRPARELGRDPHELELLYLVVAEK